MKKLTICICLTFYMLLQFTSIHAQEIDPSVFKNDPDWQLIAQVEDNFTGKFVNSKVDLKSLDLSNEDVVLNLVGMTKEEYAKNTKLVKDAANRLVKKYNLNMAGCSTCKSDINTKNADFKSAISLFQADPEKYERFRGESLGVTKYAAQCCCCGFWFYACVAVCAASIELPPIYLGCCALCYRSECCH